MNIHLMSDLHLESHYRENRQAWIQGLNNSEIDLLVLAGDICASAQIKEVMEEFCQKYRDVVFVPGNHEYYHSSPSEVAEILTRLDSKLSNFHWLNNEVRVINGLKFVGGTMWFPRPADATVYKNRIYMNDFNVIKNFEPWVYGEHERFLKCLSQDGSTADVVITHHLPADKCIDSKYRYGNMSVLNHYFCHDLTDYILVNQPKLWLYGHTHTSYSGEILNTRLICHPMGYIGESINYSRYQPKTITIE